MAQQKQDYIGIALWISSYELSPEAITKEVGLEPSYVQVRGTAIRGLTRLYERHSWKFGERLYAEQGSYIGSQSGKFFDGFFDKIKSAITNIKNLSSSNEVSIAIIYNVHDMPYLGLNCDQVQIIASMGASVNFDVMVYGSTSESDDKDFQITVANL